MTLTLSAKFLLYLTAPNTLTEAQHVAATRTMPRAWVDYDVQSGYSTNPNPNTVMTILGR
jgi:hypothetical protein